jgi:hypothetical protein
MEVTEESVSELGTEEAGWAVMRLNHGSGDTCHGNHRLQAGSYNESRDWQYL